jgi:hypothetical protein
LEALDSLSREQLIQIILDQHRVIEQNFPVDPDLLKRPVDFRFKSRFDARAARR